MAKENICSKTYELIHKARKLEYDEYIDIMSENEQEGQFAVQEKNVVAIEEYNDANITHHVFLFPSEDFAKLMMERLMELASLHEHVVHVPKEELVALAIACHPRVVHIKCYFDEEVQ